MKEYNLPETVAFILDASHVVEYPDEESEKEAARAAKAIVKQYGWKKVFEAVMDYMVREVKTPEDVAVFATQYSLFWRTKPIPKPHVFLGYLYYRIGLDVAENDPDDILYGLVIELLPRCGYEEADLNLNAYYEPSEDPKIIAAAEEWKNMKK